MSDVPELSGVGRWAAAGAVSPNEVYLGGRLSYLRSGEVEKQFAEDISGRQAIELLMRSLAIAMLFGVLSAGLCLLASVRWYEDGLTSATTWAPIVTLIVFFVVLVAPGYELLSEWQLLLDGKAKAADSSYAVIFRVLKDERRIPVKIQAKRRVTGPPVRGVRNFLIVQLGEYRMQVSVFAFGADLYLGWTLWRRQSSISIIFGWLASFFLGNRGFWSLIDVEPVKALRESVHNAVREGVEAAAAELDVSLITTFGYEIPIEGPQSEMPIEGRSRMSVPVPPPAPSTAGPSEEESTVLVSSSPVGAGQFQRFAFSVARPVWVQTLDGLPVTQLRPGHRYWAVDEHPTGLVVLLEGQAVVVADRSVVVHE